MPLPNPDYLDTVYYDWDGTNEQAVILENGTPTTSVTSIRWSRTGDLERERFHNLIMAYANKNSLTEANALTVANSSGWHVVNFGGTVVGGNNTGLVSGQVYTTIVEVDGTDIPFTVDGADASTFTDLISELNTTLSTNATASIVNGNIDITSATTGNSSSVKVHDDQLFEKCNGFVSIPQPYAGVDTVEDVLQLNFYGTNPIADILHPKVILATPNWGPVNTIQIYFDHSDQTWKYLYDDSVVT